MSKVSEHINKTLDIAEEYYAIFGKPIPPGKMYCCFHDNKNTPAAKRYGNVIHCFSCGKSYTVYDLLSRFNPSRIEEIKSSVLLEDVNISKPQTLLRRITIDRNKSIEEILKQILS